MSAHKTKQKLQEIANILATTSQTPSHITVKGVMRQHLQEMTREERKNLAVMLGQMRDATLRHIPWTEE